MSMCPSWTSHSRPLARGTPSNTGARASLATGNGSADGGTSWRMRCWVQVESIWVPRAQKFRASGMAVAASNGGGGATQRQRCTWRQKRRQVARRLVLVVRLDGLKVRSRDHVAHVVAVDAQLGGDGDGRSRERLRRRTALMSGVRQRDQRVTAQDQAATNVIDPRASRAPASERRGRAGLKARPRLAAAHRRPRAPASVAGVVTSSRARARRGSEADDNHRRH